MGLFDDIEVDWPLPDGFDGKHFQTKDLECYMERYRITREGALERHRREGDTWTNEDFHGILNFYDYGPTGEWHEYNAKFTDGKVVGIEAVEGSA